MQGFSHCKITAAKIGRSICQNLWNWNQTNFTWRFPNFLQSPCVLNLSGQIYRARGTGIFSSFMTSPCLGGGSPPLYYHDCSGTTSQVTPQGLHWLVSNWQPTVSRSMPLPTWARQPYSEAARHQMWAAHISSLASAENCKIKIVSLQYQFFHVWYRIFVQNFCSWITTALHEPRRYLHLMKECRNI